MSLSQILLILIGVGLVVGTMYMMIRAIFLPTPTDPAYPKKKPASQEQPVKNDKAKA